MIRKERVTVYEGGSRGCRDSGRASKSSILSIQLNPRYTRVIVYELVELYVVDSIR